MTTSYKIHLISGATATNTNGGSQHNLTRQQTKNRIKQYGENKIQYIEESSPSGIRQLTVDEFVRQNDKKNI